MMNRLALLLLLMPVCCVAQYKGGQDDGAMSNKIQSKQNVLPGIYKGGPGKIYAYTLVAGQNPLPGIYGGGREDGVAIANPRDKKNAIPGIYNGGRDDGAGSVQVSLHNLLYNIYAGGDDEGTDSRIDSTQNKLPSIYTG